MSDIELVDLGVYAANTLILTDFHIGYEEALNKQGILVPRFQFKEIIQRLDAIFRKLRSKKIDKIVILGDLKHEFGRISDQEWRHTLQLLDYFSKKCNKILLLKGNHDAILGPIAEKRNVKVRDYYLIDTTMKNNSKKSLEKINNNTNENSIKKALNAEKPLKKLNNKNRFLKTINIGKKNSKNRILCLHGDKIPDKELLKGVSTIIIGHEHPAVSIKDGPRAEIFKCFLVGKWKRKNLIVMPSFNLVTEGTDIMKEKLLSPFLKGNLGNFDVVVVADKLYGFGKVKEIQ